MEDDAVVVMLPPDAVSEDIVFNTDPSLDVTISISPPTEVTLLIVKLEHLKNPIVHILESDLEKKV
jgi:hypothetical protein